MESLQKVKRLQKQFPQFIGTEAEPPRLARYAVNEAMIRNWVEAHDDNNSVYVDATAKCNDYVTAHFAIESISEFKQTALGHGCSITLLKNYVDKAGKTLMEERFRILRFNPDTQEVPA